MKFYLILYFVCIIGTILINPIIGFICFLGSILGISVTIGLLIEAKMIKFD